MHVGTLVLAGLLASTPAATVTASHPVADMLERMEGTYRAIEGDLVDRRVRVEVPLLGEHVMYWQLNTGPEAKVYRQRLLVFEHDAERNVVVQRAWTFTEPERYVDAFSSPELFTTLTEDDVELTLPDGCEQLWQLEGDAWHGKVDRDSCRIWSERRQQWRRIESEVRMTEDEYWTSERGFDDAGNQVFGTPPGEFVRLRRSGR